MRQRLETAIAALVSGSQSFAPAARATGQNAAVAKALELLGVGATSRQP